jgi:hypothetical protein
VSQKIGTFVFKAIVKDQLIAVLLGFGSQGWPSGDLCESQTAGNWI